MKKNLNNLISNGALRGTRLAGGRRPEVNRSSELRILERSGNRAGQNEYIEIKDFKNLLADLCKLCAQKVDISLLVL